MGPNWAEKLFGELTELYEQLCPLEKLALSGRSRLLWSLREYKEKNPLGYAIAQSEFLAFIALFFLFLILIYGFLLLVLLLGIITCEGWISPEYFRYMPELCLVSALPMAVGPTLAITLAYSLFDR